MKIRPHSRACWLVAALLPALLLPVGAQTEEKTPARLRDEQITAIITKRETIIARNLPMTPDEREIFWPLYKKYRAERDQVETRVVKLAAELEANLSNITSPLAHKLTTEMLELQRTDLAIKTKYLRSFEKILTPPRAAKFYQLEQKLDAVINYYRAERVPLIP